MKKLFILLLCLGLLTACTSQSGVEALDGDVVKIDFVGKLDGTAFSGGTAYDAILELGSNTYIDGFEEQVVGMKTGQKRTITVTFPENYQSSTLAGQECTFDITLNHVYQEVTEACQSGDIVKIDYVGKIQGEVFQGGTANGYLLELGSGTFIDGFEDQLIGMEVAQQKTITVTFPANYGSTYVNGEVVELSDQEVTFDVAVNHIYREVQ